MPTIRKGIKELERSVELTPLQSRRPGGGRKNLTEHYVELPQVLDTLIDPVMRGDPESPLRWTCKSTRLLANELHRQGYEIGPTRVRFLLHEMEYSLQANRKTREGKDHPDRNDQFLSINDNVKKFLQAGQPVISVDTKKKENLGNYSNKGPGTSQWNKIEHRLFSFITQNWRGKPLYDLVTVVNLISNTTTGKGLLVKSAVDTNVYPKGIKVSDNELACVKLKLHDFHGEWNYTVKK